MNKISEEKGSITLYVLVVMLFIVVYLTSSYVISSSSETIGLEVSRRIKEIYEKNVDEKERIYTLINEETEISTNGYVGSNLVLYYDAINNTGNGHSNNTTIWKDLSMNNNDGSLKNFSYNTSSGWGENFLSLDGLDDFVSVDSPYNIPVGNSPYTIEVSFIYNMYSSIGGLVNLGVFNSGNSSNAFRFNGNGFRHYYWGNDLDLTNVLTIGNKYTATVLNYGNDRRIYLNGELKKKDTAIPNTILGNVTIGKTLDSEHNNNPIYAVRIYDKALTDEEILNNYKIDINRFYK